MTAWRRHAAMAAFASLAVAASGPVFAQAQKPARASAASASAAAPAAATAVGHGERFRNECSPCHGVNGRSDMPGVPVLAGQHSLYAVTQLFLFREGRRSNEAMTAVAKLMKDNDLRGFSDHIGTLPAVPPPPPATPPDTQRMSRGQALAQEHKCLFCHGTDLAGGQGVARIGGQQEDYLLATLKGYKSGERAGYTRAMTEAMSQVPESAIPDLAYFAARTGGK